MQRADKICHADSNLGLLVVYLIFYITSISPPPIHNDLYYICIFFFSTPKILVFKNTGDGIIKVCHSYSFAIYPVLQRKQYCCCHCSLLLVENRNSVLPVLSLFSLLFGVPYLQCTQYIWHMAIIADSLSIKPNLITALQVSICLMLTTSPYVKVSILIV